MLIRERYLVQGGAYSDLIVNGALIIIRQRLFEARHLLEEIW